MYVFEQIYENRQGQSIKLVVKKHPNSTEVTIKNNISASFRKKCTILTLIIVINVIAFALNIVKIKYFIVVLVFVTFFVFNIVNTVKEESLLLIKHLGYQVNVEYVFGNSTSRFISYNVIDGIFVNEVISKQQVLFMLSVRVKELERTYLIPLFTGSEPRLKCIEVIYGYFHDLALQ